MNRSLRALPGLVLVVVMIMSALPGTAFASNAEITLTSLMQEGAEPITVYGANTSDIPHVDPQVATDVISIGVIENLFLGLTDFHPETSAIRAELATDWSFDAETNTWTFTLRDDIQWVHWNPVTDEATAQRPVVASDIVYGIRRGCDPNTGGSTYSAVVAALIAGCDTVFNADPASITAETLEQIQVAAPDDTTVSITLQGPIGYFFSVSGLWTLRAVPAEVIEEFGTAWVEPGNIWTNGPFVFDEWVRGVRRVFLRNPLFPADLLGPGNVERLVTTVVEDAGTIYALYQDNQVEAAGIPGAELQAVLSNPDLAAEVRQFSDLAVFYFGFAVNKPPFDNVHARRAFSAAVNRELFVQEVRQNRGLPMMHFTPPGMFGAVPINEVGIDQGPSPGFDPEFAQAEIEAAGYPNCEGFPPIDVITYQGAEEWAEFLQAEVENNLGCDPSIFTLEAQEFAVLLETIEHTTPDAEYPNMWTLGWGPDYPDANNWLFDTGLHCESENWPRSECTAWDELVTEAQTETDPDRRIEIYRQAEEMMFGYDGEHRMMPLFLRINFVQYHLWYSGPFETDGLVGGTHWDWYTIDQAAQLAARGG